MKQGSDRACAERHCVAFGQRDSFITVPFDMAAIGLIAPSDPPRRASLAELRS
jgi:hypothetical protein